MTKRLWMYYVCGVCGQDVERVEARGAFHPLVPVEIDDHTVAANVLTSVCRECMVAPRAGGVARAR
jgi:hypothetical protein